MKYLAAKKNYKFNRNLEDSQENVSEHKDNEMDNLIIILKLPSSCNIQLTGFPQRYNRKKRWRKLSKKQRRNIPKVEGNLLPSTS